MRKKYVLFAAVALSVIAADQWTKYLVLGHLTVAMDNSEHRLGTFFGPAPEAVGVAGTHYRTKDQVVLSQDFLRLRYAENEGAAFGLFRSVDERWRGPLFHLVSLGAVVLIGFYFLKLTGAKNEVWARWGLPLVLGGALGNYLDRLARGFVIDFIDAHWFDQGYWPAFNLADSAIVVGVGLLLIDSFVRKEVKAPVAAPARD